MAARPQGIARGLATKTWREGDWRDQVERLVADDLVRWKDVAALVLGHLNPPQVGTSLASDPAMQAQYGKGSTLGPVIDWLYEQQGRCSVCGTRLELQVDHNMSGTTNLAAMTFLCRRDNVIRRHPRGGITDLTLESALMWILLGLRPRTHDDFVRLCRLDGITVGSIRFKEAWAMAEWLARESPPKYDVDPDDGAYGVLRWPDDAITRVRAGEGVPAGTETLAAAAGPDDWVAFVVAGDEPGTYVFRRYAVRTVPFAHYDLSPRPPQDVVVDYDETAKIPRPRPPRHTDLVAISVVPAGDPIVLRYARARSDAAVDVTQAGRRTFRTGDRASIAIDAG